MNINTFREIAYRYDPDPEHARHVAKLADEIFQGLLPLHNLNDHARFMLQGAAWMHDIGLFHQEESGHHKHSFDMIIQEPIPGLPDKDKRMCALIARYHRKAEPDPHKHKMFDALKPADQDTVEWLAGILRVADGLDRSHCAFVQTIECQICEECVVIKIQTDRDVANEIWGAERKQNLLIKKLNRKVKYQT
ncbi:HD domain-containing protein [bacterium]|nr:HD domain-containing protein [candidate division CSSED10-310 bacterium]